MDSNSPLHKSSTYFYNKFSVYLRLMKVVKRSLVPTWTRGFRLFFSAISGVPFTSSFPTFEKGATLLFILDYFLENLFFIIIIINLCLPKITWFASIITFSKHFYSYPTFFVSIWKIQNLLIDTICTTVQNNDVMTIISFRGSSQHWKHTNKMWVYENKPCQVFVLCKFRIWKICVNIFSVSWNGLF